MYLAYTIFADRDCAIVRGVQHAYGIAAEQLLRSFRNVKCGEPREGDVIALCRIDRIGSEEAAA